MIPPRRTTRAAAPRFADTPKPPAVGDVVEILWEGEGAYFRGNLVRHDGGPFRFQVVYDDGDRETVDLDAEFWRYAESTAVGLHKSFVPGDVAELWMKPTELLAPSGDMRWPGEMGSNLKLDVGEDPCALEYRPKISSEPLSPTNLFPQASFASLQDDSIERMPIKVRLKRAVALGRL